MFFKKVSGRIFGVSFSEAEQKALNKAIGEQCAAIDRQMELDRDSSILWMLHEQFGFGHDRLFKAWKLMFADSKKLQARYELGPEAGGWLCRQKLKELGVDLERWYKDESLNPRQIP